MKTRLIIVAVLTAAALTGCARADRPTPADASQCVTVTEGATVAAAPTPVCGPNGKLLGRSTTTCRDGRQLVNAVDWWWYDGQPAHAGKIPAVERDSCASVR